MSDEPRVRNLVIVLGDQLAADSAAFDGFDPIATPCLQMEVMEEATYVRQHKKRIAFFSAMRHFRVELEARGRRVNYVDLEHPQNTGSLEAEIDRVQRKLKPLRSIILKRGDWRVREKLRRLRQAPEVRADRHFLFMRARPIMETFYRFMRRETGLLIDQPGNPVGGSWNFDSENRRTFGRKDPTIPEKEGVAPDQITQGVLKMVERKFAASRGQTRC